MAQEELINNASLQQSPATNANPNVEDPAPAAPLLPAAPEPNTDDVATPRNAASAHQQNQDSSATAVVENKNEPLEEDNEKNEADKPVDEDTPREPRAEEKLPAAEEQPPPRENSAGEASDAPALTILHAEEPAVQSPDVDPELKLQSHEENVSAAPQSHVFKRPAGRAPKGCSWDASKGVRVSRDGAASCRLQVSGVTRTAT